MSTKNTFNYFCAADMDAGNGVATTPAPAPAPVVPKLGLDNAKIEKGCAGRKDVKNAKETGSTEIGAFLFNEVGFDDVCRILKRSTIASTNKVKAKSVHGAWFDKCKIGDSVVSKSDKQPIPVQFAKVCLAAFRTIVFGLYLRDPDNKATINAHFDDDGILEAEVWENFCEDQGIGETVKTVSQTKTRKAESMLRSILSNRA